MQSAFVDLLNLCDEAKGIHGSLMGMLPESENEKRDMVLGKKLLQIMILFLKLKCGYHVLKMVKLLQMRS